MSAEEYSPRGEGLRGEGPADPRIGLVLLERYRIVRKIGSGGMGDVYEGVHQMIGKRLAIKCMHADYAANVEAVARFKREARAATAVGNEHIVDVSDLGDLPDGSPFMVMEYLEGCELAGLVKNDEPLPSERVIQIVIDVLEALAQAHESGVVHRDMKPENIFLVERGGNKDFVKILDFGISMISEQADAAMGRMTQTGMAMGTPHYMSPEQARGDKAIDHRTDLYSVGVILYQALTGALPLEASSLAVLMSKILLEEPTSLLDHRPELPAALDRIVLRAMSKDAAGRYSSAQEFAAALKPFLDPSYRGKVVPRGKARAAVRAPGVGNATVQLNRGEAVVESPVETSGQGGPEVAKETEPLPFLGGNTSEGARENTERVQSLVEVETPRPDFSEATLMAAGINSDKRSKTKRVVAVLAVAGLAAGAFVMLGRKQEASEPPAKVPRVKLVAKPEMVAPKTTSPQGGAPAAAVREVHVRITTVPAEAKVYLDGKPFPNGAQVAQPRSLAPVRVQVVLAGYRAIDDVAIFDEDRTLVFELEKSDVGAVPAVEMSNIDGAKGRSAHHRRRKGIPGTVAGENSQKSGAKAGATTSIKQAIDDKKQINSNKIDSKKTNPNVYSGAQGTVREDF